MYVKGNILIFFLFPPHSIPETFQKKKKKIYKITVFHETNMESLNYIKQRRFFIIES